MDFVNLGRTDEKIPVLCLGTWELESNPEQSIKALRTGFEKGIKFVDTAETYNTEELVGKAIKGYDDIFISTKVYPTNFAYQDVLKSCDASLKRLGVRTIDLYQLHKPNRTGIPISETMRAMEELVKQGKIRYIGLSTFSVNEIKEAQAALKSNKIVSMQIEYNIMTRYAEKDVIPFCKEQNITILAFRPFHYGAILNDKEKATKLMNEISKKFKGTPTQKVLQKILDDKESGMYSLLRDVGSKYDKTPAQVALNWVISQGNTSAIFKAGSPEHVIENAQASSFRLRKEDLKILDKLCIVS